MDISPALRRGIQFWVDTYIKNVRDEGTREVAQVASSCLSEVAYDVTTQTLTVTFVESGATYNYLGCPESEYENLVLALSVGESYNENIKYDYPYIRIG